MENKNITIKDIAKLTGVSRGTVDRVLNNRGKVAKDKKEQILKIAKELGYQKNMLARNLALNKKRQVNIIVPYHDNEQYWKMVYEGIRSVENILIQHNLVLSFFEFDLHSKEDYLGKLKQAAQNSPDVLLLSPVYLSETLHFLECNKQKELLIFTLNSELNHESIISFTGQDSFKVGLVTAKLFHMSMKKTKNKILCVTLGHSTDNAVHIQKKLEGLATYNKNAKANFDITYLTIDEFYNDDILKEKCNEIEAIHPHFDGILFTNSRAKPFIKHSKYFADKSADMITIGFDLIDTNIKLLEDEVLDYLLNEQPYQQGRISILSIFDHLIYNKPTPQNLYLPTDIVIKENYDSYLSTKYTRSLIETAS